MHGRRLSANCQFGDAVEHRSRAALHRLGHVPDEALSPITEGLTLPLRYAVIQCLQPSQFFLCQAASTLACRVSRFPAKFDPARHNFTSARGLLGVGWAETVLRAYCVSGANRVLTSSVPSFRSIIRCTLSAALIAG